jgi:hypothetical protein
MSVARASKPIKLTIPTWAASLYIFSSIILIPWTVYLGASLPTHHLSAHWDVSWSGLDVALIVTMLATGFLAYRKSRWLAITSSTVGSLLLVDAWFDVMSERHGFELYQALLLATLLEIPMSFTSYYIAYKVLKRNV